MTTSMPESTKPANNAKNTPTKGEPRRGKPKGKAAKQQEGSTPQRKQNKDEKPAKGQAKDSPRRDEKRKQSPAVTVPKSAKNASVKNDGTKFSGSTFHLSPNASSLPRPAFKNKNSPPLNSGSLNGSLANAPTPAGAPSMANGPSQHAAGPPPPMMYRPAPQYGVPYGAFPGYPSGAYPPVMHTPMGMVPPSGVPAYGGGPIGMNPMGPIAGYPPMVMNAPPPSHMPH